MESARKNLVVVIGALLSLGLVMVYSASFVMAEKQYNSPTYFFQRQAIWLLMGCAAMYTVSRFDYHILARQWKWVALITFVMLAGVLIPGLGLKINGARRWYGVGPLTFQPSEAAKPLMILAVAGWIAQTKEKIETLRHGLIPGVALAGTGVMLIAMEPDMGTAGLLAIVLGAMLFTAGVKLRHAIPFAVCALPIAIIVAYTKLGYIRDRIESFMNGAIDERGKGYQITQAMMAQGTGGIFGTGLGQGHSKLLYLPEAHNDFIFAQISEELGLIGGVMTAFLFAMFVVQGWRIARRAPDMLGTLIALGITLSIGMQAAINIAVVTHSMPTKGIGLPMISYGGSSLVLMLAGLGMLLNVASHAPCEIAPSAVGAVQKPNSSKSARRASKSKDQEVVA